MQVEYEIINIEEPIRSLSHDEANGFYINAENISGLIDEYINQNEYDHIFAVVKIGDSSQNVEIPVNDWIGLGGMDYLGIGLSNIRIPSDETSYIYEYNSRINTFPEEVYIHEFLHSLERNSKEYGYSIPELHDNEKYGYENERLIGLKNWYSDYMQCKILNENNEYIGLNKEIYVLKPPHDSDFEHTIEKETGLNDENLFEIIRTAIKIFNNNINIDKENVINNESV